MKKVSLIFLVLAAVMIGVSSCGNSEGGAGSENHNHDEDSAHHEGDGHNH
jgi:predicted small secreted protein